MKILFICKSNVCRSQMAEALYEKYSKNPKVRSAGYSPGEWLGKNLDTTIYVKVCLDEEGIDVRKKISKKVDKEMVRWADKIIVFDSKKQDWPEFLRNSDKVKIWEVEDPRHGDFELHRKTKNEIKKKVRELVKELENN